jgi:hypothetical protein
LLFWYNKNINKLRKGKNMAINFTATRQKIEIPKTEYNLLKEVYDQFKKQILLSRIVEAEENLKKGKVKKTTINKFIKSI